MLMRLASAPSRNTWVSPSNEWDWRRILSSWASREVLRGRSHLVLGFERDPFNRRPFTKRGNAPNLDQFIRLQARDDVAGCDDLIINHFLRARASARSL